MSEEEEELEEEITETVNIQDLLNRIKELEELEKKHPRNLEKCIVCGNEAEFQLDIMGSVVRIDGYGIRHSYHEQVDFESKCYCNECFFSKFKISNPCDYFDYPKGED